MLSMFLNAPSSSAAPDPSPPSFSPAAQLIAGTAPPEMQNRSAVTAEVERILKMPVTPETFTKEQVDVVSQQYITREAFEGTGQFQGMDPFRLLVGQAMAAFYFDHYGIGFYPLGVGAGKTGVSLLIPQIALKQNITRTVLIIPSGLADQLVNADIPFWRKRINIGYRIHVLSGRDAKTRRRLSAQGRDALFVISDSQMSTPDTLEVFDNIRPQMIIVDEAHLFMGDSARSKRLFTIIDKFNSKLVPMSGTLTSKSIMDYYRLARYSLGDFNFLPNLSSPAREWGAMIDAEATKDNAMTHHWRPGPIAPLIPFAEQISGKPLPIGVAGFRKAFSIRMRTTPGVVCSAADMVGTSLTFENIQLSTKELAQQEGWDRIESIGRAIEHEMITPNGDEIEYALHVWKWMYQIYGSGFYTELIWPSVENLMERTGWNRVIAEDMLARAQNYHAAKQHYHREVRRFLTDGHLPGLDTPMLIAAEMARNGNVNVSCSLHEAWVDYHRADFPERELLGAKAETDDCGRLQRAVRLSDFKQKLALKWAQERIQEKEGGIIWVYHQEVARWCVEVLKEAGVPVRYYPAGVDDSGLRDPSTANTLNVCSMTAHGTGKNLQHHRNQLFLQHKRPAKDMEQILGRLHRTGQKADNLIVNTLNMTMWDHLIFAATLNDSLYIHQSTGIAQKMIISNYNPTPRIFPSEVLREKMEGIKSLSPKDAKLLTERFGIK